MSNIIPPLLSDTPPPPPDVDDHEEDEFGDFRGTNNLSYDCDDGFSPPGSPLQLPIEHFELEDQVPTGIFDINSNSKENIGEDSAQLDKSKDFCDKRKSSMNNSSEHDSVSSKNTMNSIQDEQPIPNHNTTPPFIENHTPTDEKQEFNHLKNNEIIETNCDTKNTSSQKGFSNLSSRDDLFSKSIESPEIAVDIEKSSSDDNVSAFDSITVHNGANSIAKATLNDNNVDIGLSKQSKNIGNNVNLEDATQLRKNSHQIDNESVKIAQQTGNEFESSQISNKDLLKIPESLQNVQTSNEYNSEGLILNDSQTLSSNPLALENEKNNVEQNALGLSDDEFGAFIDNSRDLNLANGDFGDFTSVQSNLIENIQSTTSIGEKMSNFVIADDDFSDFAANQANSSEPSLNDNLEEHEFEDFATFSSLPQKYFDEDDFGDYATTSVAPADEDSSESSQYSKIILLNEKQALDKSTEIVKEMFPVVEQKSCDFEYKGLEADDKIFNQIKNITDTHALLFQWPKSASQNLLLKALNIDLRNILYGPGWNPSMPRFAANLSVTPLEPVKSEILTPTPAKEPNPSNTSQSANVDALQFDLSDMSLPDPLDFSSQSMLLDLGQLVAQLETPSFKSTSFSHNSSYPANEFENWEAWLESIPPKVPVNSADTSGNPELKSKEPAALTKLEPILLHRTGSNIETFNAGSEQKATPTIVHDDFDDFVSYSSPSAHESPHGHSIVLRETHISNKDPVKGEENDIVSWLEPTIVTPELSRKERQFVEPEDEFEDFQMVIAPNDPANKLEASASLTVKPLEVVQTQPARPENEGLETSMDLDFIEENFKAPKSGTATDDDFGDFTFSLPNEPGAVAKPNISSTAPIQPLAPAPLLEPLKPSIIQSQGTSSISWPDPGITDDEISRFEALGYSRVQNKLSLKEEPSKTVISQSHNNTSKPTKTHQNSKPNSLDDEEWSDFVSGQNASPIHKLKMEKERSSTPDLPLSVLNLGSVQPAKQPIPVITPNGLVQTKLSSNMSLNFPNMMQQTNRVYPQPQLQNNALYQPSIISNQYASQAYGGFGSHQAKTSGDDDEWSDFVSHQSKPSPSSYNQPNQLSNWLNNAPNIITNPAASFEVFSGSGVQKQAKKVPGPAQNRRSAGVPSVSIPDLDFLAPRNRTTQRK